MTPPVSRRALGWAVVMFAIVLVADQASKSWMLHGFDLPARGSAAILPGLNFTMVWNHGVTFGMFNGLGALGPVLLAGFAVAVILGLIWWLIRTPFPATGAALGAIIGGAIGNIVDRLRYGAVVDFIHAHAFGWSWYVFNIADAAVVCGVGVLLFENFRRPPAS
ncbi:signal peptidase II [Endobacter medicaginis]|jgi:signal peptidase II|nr:signal peptidase II [Endobacter medicaginis]MCX5476449.1 signal peptidase II [Endobacter medicaginis]NVN29648.1 signal peptidase II [Endobacter medicaginis]